MEVKKVMPISVKPVGGTAPVAVKPVAPVAVPAVKPVAVPTPAVQAITAEQPKEEVKGGLFSTPSVADTPKEERLADIRNAVDKVQKKNPVVSDNIEEEVDNEDNEEDSDDIPDKKAKGKAKAKKEEKKKYEGPRAVRVYGMELFVEPDPNVDLETIRKRIVEEFHYPEFSKERTEMSIDNETGIVVPLIKFEKRG